MIIKQICLGLYIILHLKNAGRPKRMGHNTGTCEPWVFHNHVTTIDIIKYNR